MLLKKITKEQYDALPEVLQNEYKGDGAGYVLDTDDKSDDTTSLKNALERVKEEKRLSDEAARILREEKAERERTEQERIREGILAGGNVAEIRATLEQEREQLRASKDADLDKKNKFIGKLLVDDRANTMAIKLAGKHAKLLLPHIKVRLQADFSGDEPRAVVVTESGGPSTLSIEDLEKELLLNPDFASILIGVDSSGGDTSRTSGGDASKKPNEYTEAERIALYTSDPAKFHRLFPH